MYQFSVEWKGKTRKNPPLLSTCSRAMSTKTVTHGNSSLSDSAGAIVVKDPKHKEASNKTQYPAPHGSPEINRTPHSPRKVNFKNQEDNLDTLNQSESISQKSQISSPKRKSRKSVFGAPSKIRSSSESDIPDSSSEFRNGLRLQTKAYERRGNDEASMVRGWNSRSLISNAYVERLKQFYQYENIMQSYFFPPVRNSRTSIQNNFENGDEAISRSSSLERLPTFRQENHKNIISHHTSNPSFKHNLPSINIMDDQGTATPNEMKKSKVKITVTSPSGKTLSADDSSLEKPNKLSKSKHSRKKNSTHKRNSQSPDSDAKKTSFETDESSKHRVLKSKNDQSDNMDSQESKPSRTKDIPGNPKSKEQSPTNAPPPVTSSVNTQSNHNTSKHTNHSTSTTHSHHSTPLTNLTNTSTTNYNHNTSSMNSSNAKTENLTTSSTSTTSGPVDTKSILEAVQRLGLSRRSSNAAGSDDPRKKARHQQRRRHRAALENDSKNVAMKVSLPCRDGCCYCVYASLLGPVKIYLSRAERPKREPSLVGIKDGNGRPGIPVSRKEDITGLVYDAHNHSFHPPLPSLPVSSQGRRSINPGVLFKIGSEDEKFERKLKKTSIFCKDSKAGLKR